MPRRGQRHPDREDRESVMRRQRGRAVERWRLPFGAAAVLVIATGPGISASVAGPGGFRVAGSESGTVPVADSTLSVLDEQRLLGAIPAQARERFPAFNLPRRGGGRLSLNDLAGKVVLINLWASWCSPCRTEMPALDSLRQSLADPGFVFLAISEDLSRKHAERFLAELGFDFPVLFGDGRQQRRFQYPGLPYTLLLDREGRIVRRWIGQLGRSDLELIRTLARQELGESAPASETGGSPHRHPSG